MISAGYTIHRRKSRRINDVRLRLEERREVTAAGCWLWLGGMSTDGYGRTSFHGRTHAVHRVAYELFVGPIPSGLQIDHLCRERSCFNPDHLEAVTGRENALRAPDCIPTRNAAKTHCPKGHAYDKANTYLFNDSKRGVVARRCRACKREASRKGYAA